MPALPVLAVLQQLWFVASVPQAFVLWMQAPQNKRKLNYFNLNNYMPTVPDYPRVSWIWHKSPGLLFRYPTSKLFRALWWRGGKRKESLQLCLCNLNIYIEKVDVKCWVAEMTLVTTSLPLAHVFQCLFTFALVSASCWRIGGGIQIPERRRLCKLHCITIQTWRMGAVGFDWCIAVWFRDWVQLCDLCSLGGEGSCVIHILWRGWCKRDSVLLYRILILMKYQDFSFY